MVDAGEVSHAFQTDLIFRTFHDLNGSIPSCASGAISHGDIAWFQFLDVFQSFKKLYHPFFRFWRKEFEGEDGMITSQYVSDFHKQFILDNLVCVDLV